MTTAKLFRNLLMEAKKKNPRYSLRALALKSGISSGRLSELLSEKRPLSDYYFEKICQALNPNTAEMEKLRRMHFEQQKVPNSPKYGKLLTEVQVSKLSNWKPYAILSLLQTKTYLNHKSPLTTWDCLFY